jgi:chloramphenicol 3-O phosphotransferase
VEKGKIIILNGVPSAGKSTLAKTLQNQLSEPYFHMDVDVFCLMAPEKYSVNDYSLQWKFVSNMFQAVKLFSDMGFNLVVPVCFLERGELYINCVTLLHDYTVLFVHVKCPAEELRRREKGRGNRNVGDAEYTLSALVPKNTYDVAVDTHKYSTEKCADMIIDRFNSQEEFTAFKTLWSSLHEESNA